VKDWITDTQRNLRSSVGEGLARAFGGGLLYGVHEEEGERDEAGDDLAAAPDQGDHSAVSGDQQHLKQLDPEEAALHRRRVGVAAELVGQHLGLHKLHSDEGDLIAQDPAASLMSAWFQPRAAGA